MGTKVHNTHSNALSVPFEIVVPVRRVHQLTFVIEQTVNLGPLPFVEEATGVDQDITDILLLSTALLDLQPPLATALIPIAG